MTVGGIRYRMVVVEREGRWVAHAERGDNNDRFGVECVGNSKDEAAALLANWLEWQYDHAAALAALQNAEHAYHRTIAGSAFSSATEGPSAIELQKESLRAVEAARTRLDAVRARQPQRP